MREQLGRRVQLPRRSRLHGVLGGLYGATWALECAVGILFAVAAHTALTRLRATPTDAFMAALKGGAGGGKGGMA